MGGFIVQIVADENIAALHEHFDVFGDVQSFAARTLTCDIARNADVLLVRSTTRVDAALLEGTAVRFVGSATAGFDHVDTDWLAKRGIAFAYAPGCNAGAVADYVTAALMELAISHSLDLTKQALGVIGVGHVGSRVAKRAESLGMRVLRNDPPLAERGNDPRLLPLDDVLAGADIVTLHVPLTTDGAWPTSGMVNAEWLARMHPNSWLINTARGDVVNESALLDALKSNRLVGAVLDVWRSEPSINRALAAAASIATPHIAGYSREARLNGTRMIRDELSRWLNKPIPSVPIEKWDQFDVSMSISDIRRVLDLRQLTQSLRCCLADTAEPSFDTLRKLQQDRGSFPVDSTLAGI